MPAWNDYSVKDAVPADTDTLMIKDNATTGNPNKRLLFSKLWDWVMSKTYAFAQGTKSIPAAINELKTATETDSTLSTSGKAADAKAAGDAIALKANASTIAPEFSDQNTYTAGQMVLKNGALYRFTSDHAGAWIGTDAVVVTVGGELTRLDNGSGSGLTEDIKTALLACFEKVAWIDEDGQDYYDALYDALYPPADLVSISAVFTQGSAVIYDTDSLDTLKQYLVVTAHMSDSSTQTVTAYSLSGTLTEGTSTITVSYGGKTTTFTVTVSHAQDPSEQWTSGVAYTPTVIQDKYIEKATGRIKDYTGWDWTGYLPCKGAASVEVPKLGNVSDTESNALFDESFGVVQNAVGLDKNNYISIKIPASAAYIGLSQARSALAQVIEGGIIPYAAGTESNMTEWADGVEYEDISIITDTYLNNGIETSYTGWDATGFIPCNGATSLTIPPMPQQSSGVWYNSFYDRDHERVNAGLALSKTESVTVAVPARAHYFRLSSDRGALSSCISGGIVPNR